MKRAAFFSLALCLWFSLRFPSHVSASADFGAGPEPPTCMGSPPKTANFASLPYSYGFTGTCDLSITRLAFPFTVVWTGTGNYDPRNGQTYEQIVIPAPRIDEPSRLYGTFTVRMHCSADPWLTPSIRCDQIAPTVDAPLDKQAPNAQGWKQPYPLAPAILDAIRSNARPFSSIMRQDSFNALNAEYQAYLAQRKAQEIYGAGPAAIHPIGFPTILSPAAGQNFFAQTPIGIRLAPPSTASATSYLINIQIQTTTPPARVGQPPSVGWVNVLPNQVVSAADAQSLQGWTGWGNPGPGRAANYYSAPGIYRLNAQITAPRQSGWSDWTMFTVTAPPPPKVTMPGGIFKK